jgi:peptide/nickel transport system substrate-binding protein
VEGLGGGRRRLPSVVAALAAGAALLAGGCADQGGAEGDALKPVDINALPRDRVRDGGTLRWPIEELPTQWNAAHVNGANVAATAVLGGLMPNGIITDERANVTVDRNYVLSARVTSTRPKQVVTYRLNPKARWSNGRPIDWTDYEAQWKALRGTDRDYQIASSTAYERVESVRRGRDRFEVVVTFAKPFGEWQSTFAGIYPKEVNGDPERFNSAYLNEIPITAGPFKLDEIDQTAKTVTIVRDPKWWGPPAKLDRIVFRALSPDASINAFVSGEIDLVDVGPNPSNYKRVRGVRDGAVRSAAGPDYRHFTFNGTSPVLSDVNVRRAVAAAINRDALTRADLVGLNWPTRTMGNHYFVNTQEGYRDNAGEVGRFDPDRAKQMLDRAGWRPGPGGVRTKGGKPLVLRFVIPTGVATSRQEAELAQAMLRDVGVRLDIRAVPEGDFFEKYVIPGNYDVAPFSWVGTPFPISSSKSLYAMPTKSSSGELDVRQNYARIGSPRIDALMERALGELDTARASEMLNEADRLVWEEVHSLVLYQRPSITATKRDLANYGSFGFKTTVYQDIGFVR